MQGGKKILMIVGDFVEDYEVMVPYQALLMLNHTVHAVCPKKNKGDKIKTAIHDFEGDQTYTEKPGHNFEINFNFDDVKAADYDGLYLPGGRAPEYLRLTPEVNTLVAEFFKLDRPVAAVCHGVQFLTAAGVMKGRTCSGYYACGPEVNIAGGTQKDIKADEAIVDGKLVSGPAWPAHPAVLREFLKLL